MATARSSNPGGNASVDAAPLLGTQNGGRRSGRRGGLLRAAWFIRRTSSRQMMREPSMMVRETAAEHLEERQTDWAYSKPVVFLDILWNLAFVGVAVGVLILSRNEAPLMPLRLWIVGYALQCVLHMVCVCIEYRRRHLRGGAVLDEEEGGSGRSSASNSPRRVGEAAENEQGQYEDNPRLCIVFLAFDVFFVVFCVALACVIGIAVCCCLPCIIAILYAIADQEGASEDDISQLSKYKFRKIGDSEKIDEISGTFGGIMTECGSDPPVERTLSADDAPMPPICLRYLQECCICLCAYEDGVELRELPCDGSGRFYMFCYRPLNFLQEFVGGGGGRFLEHFSSRATGGRGGGHFLELFASTRRRIGSILSSSAAALWPASVTPLDASPTTVLVSAGWRRVGYGCGDPSWVLYFLDAEIFEKARYLCHASEGAECSHRERTHFIDMPGASSISTLAFCSATVVWKTPLIAQPINFAC
ncbi:E3 ubiquitin-protein ligase [Musa troglodytarum]|uniref:RING-type E3 ubiquitin transferase n=1 Tax=Musa troglodytarum TaxID=320322 RepID=A0A9E7L2A1_9LILI|nr:E3 ubiquitin-protein ligase [Musa troglodytarum]